MAAGPYSVDEMPEEERNCLVLCHLTTKVGINAIRTFFDRVVPPAHLASFLNIKKNKLQKLLQQKILYNAQFKLLFPTSGTVTSEDFDITLIVCLIRNTFKVTPPTTGWDTLPNPTDLTEEADIARIKYYRNNFLSHLQSVELSNVEFKKASTDVKEAISRLSNTSLDAEVQNILNLTVIPSKDLKTLQKELDRLHNVIPRHMQDQNAVITDSWRKILADHVVTKAYRYVRDKVKTNSFTTISGNPGSGKSAIAHCVALEMETDGYTIVSIKTVEELKTYIDPKSKQVFIMDDPVGTRSLDEVALAHFESYTNIISEMIDNTQIKVVITSRKVIMNDTRVKTSNTLLCQNVVDINDTKLRLSPEERKNILDQYTMHVDKNVLARYKASIIDKDTDNFPLICTIFSRNKTNQTFTSAFFEDMLKHLIIEIENVQSHHKIQFCCLVMCLFYDNDFDSDILDVFSDIPDDEKSRLNQIIEATGLSSNISRQEIIDTMEKLVDVYIIKEGTHFRFLHDAFYESVSVIFGSKHPNETLKVCSSSFIRERVRLSECTERSCIVLSRKNYIPLATRLIKELERGNFYDVCFCHFIKEPEIEDIFIECLGKISPTELLILFETENNRESLQTHIKKKEETYSKMWFFLDILSCKKAKLLHWILAIGLTKLFKYVYNTYTHLSRPLTVLPIACLSGNVNITKSLVQGQYSGHISDTWDACYDKNLSCLHMAVFSCNLEIVKYVLSLGIDVNIQTVNGETSLYIGARMGQTVICKYLIDEGAGINMASCYGRTSLFIASLYGNTEIVKVLLDKGAGVNIASKYGVTPLCAASQNNHFDIAKVLIDKQADINMARTEDGCSPLHIAVFKKNTDIVNYITNNDVSFNIVDSESRTPLYIASREGHTDIVKILIDKGANVNMASKSGRTPLNIASQNGHTDIVNVLIDKGADVSMANNDGITPLNIASQNGHTDIVNVLIDNDADVNMANNDSITPLNIASHEGHTEIVKVLMDKGAGVNIARNDGVTPLFAASQNNHNDIAKGLIDKKADTNMARTEDGCSPLHIAVFKKNTDIVKYLKNNDVSVKIVDSESRTPLYIASQFGHTDIVKIVIDKGVNVNMASKSGRTPLNIASQNGHTDIVNVLIDNDADVNMANNNGITPLNTASRFGYTDIVKILIDKGADVNMASKSCRTPLYIASQSGHTDIVNVLIDNGAGVNIVSNDGVTPLFAASQNNHIDIAKVLIDNKADINMARTEDGCSPLHIAVFKKNTDIVKYLKNNDVSVNIVDSTSCTPLYIASRFGHTDIVKILIDKGVNVNMASKSGRTPLNIASQNGHTEIVKVLIDKGAGVNIASNDGTTPLLAASHNNHIDIAKVLIDGKADINMARIKDSCSPLHMAISIRNTNIVRVFMYNDASVNKVDSDGRTPLYIASLTGQADIVKALIHKDADINIADNNGTTPLNIASQKNHTAVCDILKEHCSKNRVYTLVQFFSTK